MKNFYHLKIIDIIRETSECVSVSIEIPEKLKRIFHYIPGQYVTLRKKIRGEEVRRSYSICSCPFYEQEFRIAAKKVMTGKLSPFLNERLKAGGFLEVMSPEGNFSPRLHPSNKKNYVLFAGGSGITPIFSIVKSILYFEPASTILLFYANRDSHNIIFKNKLDTLAEENPKRFMLFHVLDENPESDALFKGVMTVDKIRQMVRTYIAAPEMNEYFICGPLPMMNNVKETLLEFAVNKQNIHIEYFTTAIEDNPAAEVPPPETAASPVTALVKIIHEGMEKEFNLRSDGKSILDSAISAGVDVPFSCKGGVCCTCKAKLLEGKVRMEKNFALTDEEVADGYILTCQSHPITPVVIVNYDDL